MQKLSPMMQQWQQCKQKAKDALLLFQLGDFYEAFYEDAKQISKELNITLTQRQGIPMCGVPLHSFDGYLDKLIALGYKVAIAAQTEDPKQVKGIVKREVVKTITPGTTTSTNLLNEKTNNYFISLTQIGKTYGLACTDLSTSEFFLLQLECTEKLFDQIHRLSPSELLVSQNFIKNNPDFTKDLSHHIAFVLNKKEDWHFDQKATFEKLISHFKVHTLEGFGLEGKNAAICAAGALLSHLQEELSLDISHIRSMHVDTLSKYMDIDHSTMHNLELIKPQRQEEKNITLFSLLDQTQTPMGARLLQKWIKNPLLCCDSILQRQLATKEFLGKKQSFNQIRNLLSSIKDCERLMMKISSKLANPRDIIGLLLSLESIPSIITELKEFSSSFIRSQKLHDLSVVISLIKNALSLTPPVKISDGNVFRDGYHEQLDELRSILKDSKTYIANYQNHLREKTGIKNLKVGYTRAFGYYIDITRSHASKVPDFLQRRQTLVNSERYVTDELKQFEYKALSAEDKILSLETSLFSDLIEQINSHSEPILETAKSIANIDVIASFSYIADLNDYCQPKVDNSDILHIEDGRHPVIENVMGKSQFIPNDTHLDQKERLYLITGPNMAGKSTFIRQVAILTIMAQIGSFIPAKSAHIGIVDKVFSRIGASDDLAKGQSTFMVEMSQTANILNNATDRSLVILDEIGRGTSTYDGISIAWAVAEYLLTTPNKKAKTLFATHYSELTELQGKIPGAINYQVSITETPSGIVFLRKIIKGGTDKSYGIHVAKIAGLPFEALHIAEKRLVLLEKTKRKAPRIKKEMDLPLFKSPQADPLKQEVKNLKLDEVTPMEALQKLYDLQKKCN